VHGAKTSKTSPLKDLRVWLNPPTPGWWLARFIGLIGEIVQRMQRRMAIQSMDAPARSWPVGKPRRAVRHLNTSALFTQRHPAREPPMIYNNREMDDLGTPVQPDSSVQ